MITTKTTITRKIYRQAVRWMATGLFSISALTVQAQEANSLLSDEDDYLLIINSYTSDAPWSNNIIDPVQHWVVDQGHGNVFIEHLNMLMIDDTAKLNKLKPILFAKYDARPPKAVLLLGNTALLLKDNIRAHWGDIPMVLCAEESYTGPEAAYIEKYPVPVGERIPITELAEPYNLTFIQSKMFPKDNINLLRRMIPGLGKVVFIGDGRYVNQQLDYDIRDIIAKNYPSLNYEFYSAAEMTMTALLDKLNHIDKATTGVLFSSWFSKSDYAGNTVLTANTFRELANTTALVFALKPAVMGISNSVGGYFYDEQTFRKQLLHMLGQVLSGTPARDIPFYIPSDAIPTFDYPVLLQKGFTVEECPPGSVFLDRPLTFWERNKYLLIVGGSLAVLSLLLLFLYQRNRIRVLASLNEARKQQAEANREMAKLFNDMPVAYMKGSLLRDNAGHITDVEITRMNRLFIRSFIGAPPSDDTQKASDLFGEDFRTFLRYVQLMDSDQTSITFSQYFSTKDEFFDIIITLATQEECIDMYCISATDLHRIQQQLDETNRKLAMSLDVANITPWNWNLREHKILCDVNRPVELIREHSDADEEKLAVPESQYFSKIHKEDRPRVEQAFKDLIEGKIDRIKEEYRVVTRNHSGHRMDWVEAQAAVDTRDEQGCPQTLVGSSLVITQRKEMERELIAARDKAEESNRLKSAFLANMSHEIRTPLNAIVGFSALLNSVDETQEREEYVRIIENNNDLLLQLISDILDLSKIEAGTLEIAESVFDVSSLVSDAVRALQLRADKKQLAVSVGNCLPECFIQADRNRLNQVLTNLITNAVKFTDKGGITVGYELRGKDMLYFHVTDTGCGIPADKQRDIFSRFVKLNSFAQGTGLGLPICQTIINKMGGEIGVDSEPGKGSTFWFTIPYRPAKRTETEQSARPLIPVRPDEITILIAEDNASNFQLFETILKKDYRILHAWNGREAVEMFREHRPHIVLMDINMPVMDGYEATAEIRKLSADVPVLAVTAYAYASDEQRILSYGFDGYTSKPINANALRSKINELIKARLLLMF